jgi:cobalt/nickel transport system ATP-binding protein
MAAILSVDQITYRYYQNFTALEAISLQAEEGELLAIIGANGSGKSTLLQIMSGLIYPESGRVLFRDQEVSEKTLKDKVFLRRFRERVSYVFQDSDAQLFCPTVFDELMYGPLQLGLDDKEASQRSLEILKMLSIDNLKDRPSYMLSGGEKKKVAIGSVLTMNPEILLFDEPTNGLDPRTQVFLVELMLALNESGKTIVLATHDLGLVAEIGARVVVLSEDHRIEKMGSADEILGDQDLLLRVNLIHEHVHLHGKTKHTHLHSHYLFHRH